ncbi:MAG TPA: glycosyltransferase [Ignavibacteria bacterium]|nr:glycosyl hydrolase [Bacteroidota bacterium]HRE10894.1 glycosyltransferase [Ignavibacteria bacterium]HRF66129.1 glycosyltransferase [Ignavibacteria bacterium]HRJ03495.1 glycosyltransferase [Ignavibacteria bacterium]HRJ84079.1 glycosyltransferase [Ignavibacteria bacterium]
MLICIWNLYILRRKNYPKISDDKLPFVSVLIPARNEEHNIAQIVNSLLVQDYPSYEVIVLNDNSDDRTGEILLEIQGSHPELKILNGKPLETGWTGKCFACKQLYDASTGDYILFTDADTLHNPNSLRDSVTIALSRNADMVTLFPKMRMVGFAEKLIMPMLWFTVMLLLPFYFVDKKGFLKFSIGIGPFMLFKRSAYKAIGGHDSVKNAIVEDVWLARKIKEHGMQLIVEDGQHMLSVRMYRNFKEIWNGFSKNIFAGFEFSSIALFSVNLLYILLFFIPFLLFFIQLSLQFSLNLTLILTGIQVLILYFTRAIISARFKLGFISTLLHPIGALSVPLIALNSWRWIKAGSGAKWKGRVYNPAEENK